MQIEHEGYLPVIVSKEEYIEMFNASPFGSVAIKGYSKTLLEPNDSLILSPHTNGFGKGFLVYTGDDILFYVKIGATYAITNGSGDIRFKLMRENGAVDIVGEDFYTVEQRNGIINGVPSSEITPLKTTLPEDCTVSQLVPVDEEFFGVPHGGFVYMVTHTNSDVDIILHTDLHTSRLPKELYLDNPAFKQV